MLTVTRKPGERLIITLEDGREITVVIGTVQGKKVRVSIDAPRTIVVSRPRGDDVVDNGIGNRPSSSGE